MMLAAFLLAFTFFGASLPQDGPLDLSCTTFHPFLSEAELIAKYGRENVSNGPIVGSIGRAGNDLFHPGPYETRLAAISDDSSASDLAQTYVAQLRPCYEWEVFHDCPEHEAKFADECQGAHPTGPFRN